jgi:hypothetical protein
LYSGVVTEGTFSAKLPDVRNLDVLGHNLQGGAKEYMRPAPVSSWLRCEDEGEKQA